jgi:tetratricopeptide (TPR) repeat protein
MVAQEEVRQQLVHVLLLEQKGQYEQAIRILQPLTEAGSSNRSDIGRAWTMLGVAYEQQGHYQQSQSAYEKALRLLEGNSQHLAQYATALDCFASLNSITHHPEIANKLWIKGLGIHKQLGDHRAVAKEYSFLAGAEMQKKHAGAAKKALKQAVEEAKLLHDVNEDDVVFLCDTEAWLANLEGDNKSELAAYQRSLEVRRRIHGDDFPLTGWTYLFVGNAYAEGKLCDQALTSLRQGIGILGHTVGQQNPQYLAAEIFYSKAIDRCGMHDDASHLRQQAQQTMSDLFRKECIDCTVSVSSLR